MRDLAAALAGAESEEEQERLLARNPGLMNSSLLAALKTIVNPLIRKGDYAQALRISQLAARVAERIGDPVEMGNALCDLGIVYELQNRPEQALDCLQKSFAIFEKTGDNKGKARALL